MTPVHATAEARHTLPQAPIDGGWCISGFAFRGIVRSIWGVELFPFFLFHHTPVWELLELLVDIFGTH